MSCAPARRRRVVGRAATPGGRSAAVPRGKFQATGRRLGNPTGYPTERSAVRCICYKGPASFTGRDSVVSMPRVYGFALAPEPFVTSNPTRNINDGARSDPAPRRTAPARTRPRAPGARSRARSRRASPARARRRRAWRTASRASPRPHAADARAHPRVGRASPPPTLSDFAPRDGARRPRPSA